MVLTASSIGRDKIKLKDFKLLNTTTICKKIFQITGSMVPLISYVTTARNVVYLLIT